MANGISSMDVATTIKVGDKVMTIKEFKDWVKERQGKKAAPKRKKKAVKEIGLVAMQVEKMLKPMTTLKSIQVYQNHAYRSWGTIANEILAHRGIRRAMASYCVNYGNLNTIVADIQKMAKRNEKAAYQYLDKLTWKLDDMKTNITDMTKAVAESEVCNRFKNHEAINGTGRQLGLQTIVNKCYKTISQMEDIIGTLKKMADEGTDPFAYGEHMTPKERARLGL